MTTAALRLALAFKRRINQLYFYLFNFSVLSIDDFRIGFCQDPSECMKGILKITFLTSFAIFVS